MSVSTTVGLRKCPSLFPVLAPGLFPPLCLLLANLFSVEPLRQALLKALLTLAQ